MKVSRLNSALPNWYDAEYLKANKIKPEAGATIRARVDVTTKNITQQLTDEESKLARLYPHAKLHVVPKLVREVRDDELQLTGRTDKQLVKQYVAATLPKAARFEARRAISYLTTVLGQTREGITGTRLDFIRAEGTNVLSFPEIRIDYRHQGIVLLRGIRKDWNRRSNGSGKTNALSLIPVSLFGETLKGQKADGWAREGTKEKADLKLVMRDSEKRKLVITRTRRPHSISLIRTDSTGKTEDLSEGITGKGKKETQGLIERTTGFDMELLKNSIYIDQSITNAFVFGTQKNRMDLVAKLQNLQKYEEGLKLITAEIRKRDEATMVLQTAASRAEEQIQQLGAMAEQLEVELRTPGGFQWRKKLETAEKKLAAVKASKSALLGDDKQYEGYRTAISEWEGDRSTVEAKLTRWRGAYEAAEALQKRAERLIRAGKCEMCGQDASGVGRTMKRDTDKEITEARDQVRKRRAELESLDEKIEGREKRLRWYEREVERAETEIEAAQEIVTELTEAAAQEKKRRIDLKHRLAEIQEKQSRSESMLKLAQEELRAADIHREMLDYSQKAVQRGGMPLYLASTLCSFLNTAADDYAEIFSDGKIKVMFDVIDSEFQASVINVSGSETSEGQSAGETAMAGIITAFAVRDAAPKSNLLILDEPASGLDPEGCRMFANGLLKLKDRWQTIIVTTHSQIIESVLAGETVWTVKKKGRISRLIQ